MHISIDIETLGVAENAVVLSIGAAAFNSEIVHEGPHIHLQVDSQISAGRTINYDTLCWMTQNTVETLLHQPRVPVAEGLKTLSEYCAAFLDKDSGVWAKGPDFDVVLVRTLYRRANLPVPWQYWQPRCVRTALMLVSEPPFQGDKHNALHDAIHQARAVQAFLRACTTIH